MESSRYKHNLVLENVWGKDLSLIRAQVLRVWNEQGGPVGKLAEERLGQLAFVVKNTDGQVAGMSTAFKVYVKQLRNYFFAVRLMLIPQYRVPGLASKLLVCTRDFLESINKYETSDQTIGIITLVENQNLKEKRNEAVW